MGAMAPISLSDDLTPGSPPPPPPPLSPAEAGPDTPRDPRQGWRRLLRPSSLVVFGAIAVTLAVDFQPLVGVVLLFALVVPFEKLFPRHPQRLRRPQVGTDIAHAILTGPMEVAGLATGIVIGVLSLTWIPALLLRPLAEALPDGLHAVLAVLVLDCGVYWGHRFGHEVPFLWRFHSVHHSTEQLDWVSGFRSHPFDGVFLAPAYLFLFVAGFTYELVGALFLIQVIIGAFVHANVRWRLAPLHRVIITPEFHHWHHVEDPVARDTNYSVMLPIWDMIFGTYRMPADARPARYGATPRVPPRLIPQMLHPFRGLTNPLVWLRHPLRGLRELVVVLRRGLAQMAASARRTPWRAPWVAWRNPTPEWASF